MSCLISSLCSSIHTLIDLYEYNFHTYMYLFTHPFTYWPSYIHYTHLHIHIFVNISIFISMISLIQMYTRIVSHSCHCRKRPPEILIASKVSKGRKFENEMPRQYIKVCLVTDFPRIIQGGFSWGDIFARRDEFF